MVINDVTGHNFGCVFLPGVSEELQTTFRVQPLYAAWRPPPGAAPSLTNIWQGW